MTLIGTKNLGLIKAIHVGVNPPLNTKIIWFNDANTPYTTGPAKVHYYYDVILADWYPLFGGAGVGGFTYIAYASNCDGADFSLTFNPATHCYWALITSNVAIDTPALTASLFEDRWTIFCRCDSNGVSNNYVYVRFTDDCDGGEIFEEPKYETECADCTFADSYEVADGSSTAFAVTSNISGGIDITITGGVTGNRLVLDTTLLAATLINLTNYTLEYTAVSGFTGELSIHIGNSGDAAIINSPIVGQKSLHLAGPNSQIEIEIGATVGTMNTSISLRLGTAGCMDFVEGEVCWKCRKYWGIITSLTELSPEEITPELFENKWLPISCDCNCGGGSGTSECCEILEEQINSIYTILTEHISQFENYVSENNSRILELEELLNSTITSFTAALNAANESIANLQTELTNLQEQYLTKVTELENSIEECCEKWSEEIFDPRVIELIANELNTFKDTTYAEDKAEIYLAIAEGDEAVTADTQTKIDVIDANLESLNTTQDNHGTTLNDHEIRITTLEGL